MRGETRPSRTSATWLVYWVIDLLLMVTGMALDFGRPAGVAWNYDRGEITADGVIHAVTAPLLIGTCGIGADQDIDVETRLRRGHMR
jgi:uncharacterized protein YbjT (DUF2867 family)